MILNFIVTCIFIIALLTSSGQDRSAEKVLQLKTELASTTASIKKQELYYELAETLLLQKPASIAGGDSAIKFLQASIALSDSTNRSSLLSTTNSLCLLGETYFDRRNFKDGKLQFALALRHCIRLGNILLEAETWHRQGARLLAQDAEPASIELSYSHAIDLYRSLNAEKKNIDLGLQLAYFHLRESRFVLAEEELLSLLEQCKKLGSYRMSAVYFYLSQVKRYTGVLHEGLKYALKSVETMKISGEEREAHSYYGELALTYQDLNMPEEAIRWFSKCLEERKKNNFFQGSIYRTTYLLIVQMIKIGEEKAALQELKKLEKSHPPLRNSEKALLEQSMAYCYSKLNQFNLAERNFQSMMTYYDKEELNAEILFIANSDIGQFYVSHQKYRHAKPYLTKAISLHTNTTLARVADLHLSMFKIDSAEGKYLDAITHYQKYKEGNDSIFNLAKIKEIEELSIRYQSATKDKNIKMLESEQVRQKEKLLQANATRNWIGGVAILFFVTIGLLVHNTRVRQRANKKLETQQKEIRRTNLSLQRLVEEKEWLVKEIHHRVKNNLHTISGLLDAQSGFLKSEDAIIAIKDSQHRVQAMSLIHQKLYQSQDMSVINMPAYINELVAYLKHSFDVMPNIRFDIQVERIDLDVSFAVPLGLILNEGITNAIKYAFPAQQEGLVSILLKHTAENNLLLSIADDGVGIPDDLDFTAHQSMGINLMRGLSQDIDGVFTMERRAGTFININFEYDPDTLINALAKDPA